MRPSPDVTGPVVVRPVDDPSEDELVFCQRCGSGDLWLPVTGDLTGSKLPCWRCSRCNPPKNDRIEQKLKRVLKKQAKYVLREKKESPGYLTDGND